MFVIRKGGFASVQQQIAASANTRAVNARTNSAYPGDVHSMADSRSVVRPTVPVQRDIGSRFGSAVGRAFGKGG